MADDRAIDRIKSHLAEGRRLSPKHRALADFIVQHPDEIAFSTAAQLARRVGTSEATVIRFANSIGYEGYPQLQAEFQSSLRSRLTTVRLLQESKRAWGPEGEEPARHILRQEISHLSRTAELIDQEVLDRLGPMLLGADPLYVVGMRASACLASYLAYQAAEVLSDVQLIVSASTEDLSRFRAAPDALAVVFAFPRYPRDTVRAVEVAASVAIPIVAITDSFASPIVDQATEIILVPHEASGFVDLMAAPITVAAAILETAARHDKDAVLQGLEAFEERVRLLDVYVDDYG